MSLVTGDAVIKKWEYPQGVIQCYRRDDHLIFELDSKICRVKPIWLQDDSPIETQSVERFYEAYLANNEPSNENPYRIELRFYHLLFEKTVSRNETLRVRYSENSELNNFELFNTTTKQVSSIPWNKGAVLLPVHSRWNYFFNIKSPYEELSVLDASDDLKSFHRTYQSPSERPEMTRNVENFFKSRAIICKKDKDDRLQSVHLRNSSFFDIKQRITTQKWAVTLICTGPNKSDFTWRDWLSTKCGLGVTLKYWAGHAAIVIETLTDEAGRKTYKTDLFRYDPNKVTEAVANKIQEVRLTMDMEECDESIGSVAFKSVELADLKPLSNSETWLVDREKVINMIKMIMIERKALLAGMPIAYFRLRGFGARPITSVPFSLLSLIIKGESSSYNNRNDISNLTTGRFKTEISQIDPDPVERELGLTYCDDDYIEALAHKLTKSNETTITAAIMPDNCATWCKAKLVCCGQELPESGIERIVSIPSSEIQHTRDRTAKVVAALSLLTTVAAVIGFWYWRKKSEDARKTQELRNAELTQIYQALQEERNQMDGELTELSHSLLKKNEEMRQFEQEHSEAMQTLWKASKAKYNQLLHSRILTKGSLEDVRKGFSPNGGRIPLRPNKISIKEVQRLEQSLLGDLAKIEEEMRAIERLKPGSS